MFVSVPAHVLCTAVLGWEVGFQLNGKAVSSPGSEPLGGILSLLPVVVTLDMYIQVYVYTLC